jgi:hypothetical protein
MKLNMIYSQTCIYETLDSLFRDSIIPQVIINASLILRSVLGMFQLQMCFQNDFKGLFLSNHSSTISIQALLCNISM